MLPSTFPQLDAHDDAALGRVAHLAEPRGRESATEADVELHRQGAGRGDHRVALDGPGPALACVVDGRAGERAADPAAATAGAGDEAGDGPDAAVALVLAPAVPRDSGPEKQARVGVSRLDGTPADGFPVHVGNQAARLVAQPGGPLVGRERAPGLARGHLVALAPAAGRVGGRAEELLDVGPRHLAGRSDA